MVSSGKENGNLPESDDFILMGDDFRLKDDGFCIKNDDYRAGSRQLPGDVLLRAPDDVQLLDNLRGSIEVYFSRLI